MVIPMQMPQISGPPPEQAAEALKKLKYCILAMGACSAGRLLTAVGQGLMQMDFFGILDMVLSVCMGAFMLKEDEHLARLHKCLASGPCAQCEQQGMGGMQCLMPFMMITMMNFVFDLLLRAPALAIQPYGLFLLGSVVSQGAAAYFSWTVYKIMRDLAPAEGTEMGGGGYTQQGDQPSASAPAAAPQQSNFTPFGGAGNRLGG
eukprot:TRINITY_DN43571_c0_g1_i1.p1 TRINITY_DN43571_c0_g1~~TRINITY_DN43571_c0_g1_i1.p1  ORF type:complete len:204 (+),score=53.73 TRINITY_DN43571_c0_g1_i1:68-679(+)